MTQCDPLRGGGWLSHFYSHWPEHANLTSSKSASYSVDVCNIDNYTGDVFFVASHHSVPHVSQMKRVLPEILNLPDGGLI